jgi:hypothetical protein
MMLDTSELGKAKIEAHVAKGAWVQAQSTHHQAKSALEGAKEAQLCARSEVEYARFKTSLGMQSTIDDRERYEVLKLAWDEGEARLRDLEAEELSAREALAGAEKAVHASEAAWSVAFIKSRPRPHETEKGIAWRQANERATAASQQAMQAQLDDLAAWKRSREIGHHAAYGGKLFTPR